MQNKIEGKTKTITPCTQPLVFLETKNIITSGNSSKQQIAKLAIHKTTQATNVFNLLKRYNIPTAFIERENDTTMLCYDCDMLPLKFVMRRYAWGSFLKRMPEYKYKIPHKFPYVLCELFHKHTLIDSTLVDTPMQMPETEAAAKYLKDGKWMNGVYPDPYLFILNDYICTLHNPQFDIFQDTAIMEIPTPFTIKEYEWIKEKILIPVFTILEDAWKKIFTKDGTIALVDMKIELGYRKDTKELVVADVIDNDSWRIWPGGDPKNQLDKQCYRDNETLPIIEDKYELVAELTNKF